MKGECVEAGHWRFGDYHAVNVEEGWVVTKQIVRGTNTHSTWITTTATLKDAMRKIREEQP